MPNDLPVLEGECRAAINTVGLEPSVGYLHESSSYQTKQSLVYDLQEPFRWLADVAVMDSFESRVLNLPDFYFTGDDYRYRFEPEAKRRFLDLLRDGFNSGVRYKGHSLKWDTIIELKADELGRFFVGKSSALGFVEPAPKLERQDNHELRARILALTASQARHLGIGRSTLHYLRRQARGDFTIYSKTRQRLVGDSPEHSERENAGEKACCKN